VIAMNGRRSREAKQRSQRYGRMFTMLFFGIFFFAAGVMGLSLSKAAGGPKWTGRPVLSQIAVGIGMLALGVYWSRRLDDPRLRTHRSTPLLKHVGRGRSEGAKRQRDELQP
jgi:hypothetical protein